MNFFELSPCHNTCGHKYKLFKHQTTACVRSNFSVNVLSMFGTSCLMTVSILFIGFDVVSCILICLATLGIVVGLVDFYFLLSILCVLLILSRLIRATISVFFVPCCPDLLSFYLSYLTYLNLIINGNENGERTNDRMKMYMVCSIT